MKCPVCHTKCKCKDSRKELRYGIQANTKIRPIIKQRRYVCPQCVQSYYTEELLIERGG